MATKALADISSEQTTAASGDLLFIESGGTPAKITYANFSADQAALAQTLTNKSLTGATINSATYSPCAEEATDADNITTSGWFEVDSAVANIPHAGAGWFIHSYRIGATSMMQVAYSNASTYQQTAKRVMTSGTWGSWSFEQRTTQTLATTSGTTPELTSIPIYANRIALHFDGVSVSGTDQMRIRVRETGTGVISSGYNDASFRADTTVATIYSTDGFYVNTIDASAALHGLMTLERVGLTNVWSCRHQMVATGAPIYHAGGGRVEMSSTLDGIQISTNGTDTFDAGSITAVIET